MTPQIIVSPKGERFVVIPKAQYLAMLAKVTERISVRPKPDFVEKFIAEGGNKVRAWRIARGLSASELADRVGISPAFLSQIEGDSRNGTFNTIKRIAAALKIKVSDLA